MADKEIQLGEVGIDSGSLLLIDPCYLDDNWKRESEATSTGIKFWGMDEKRVNKKFGKSPIKVKNNRQGHRIKKRIEEFCQSNKLTVVTDFQSDSSYNKCRELIKLKEKGDHQLGGQLYYELGHPGLGVVAATGFGDGVYFVTAIVGEFEEGDKRIKEIRIKFIEEAK